MRIFKTEEKIIITKTTEEMYRIEYIDETKEKVEEITFKREVADFGDFIRKVLNYFLEKYLHLAVLEFKEFREDRTVVFFK